jgi:hypothetical protein
LSNVKKEEKVMQHPEIFIVAIIFFSIVWIFKILSDNRVKKKLIEEGKLNTDNKILSQVEIQSNPLSSLRWGLVFVGIGVAILVSQFFPYSISEEMIFALMFLFAGLGFILYYFIARSQLKGKEQSKV